MARPYNTMEGIHLYGFQDFCRFESGNLVFWLRPEDRSLTLRKL